jgi:hypothetical protein
MRTENWLNEAVGLTTIGYRLTSRGKAITEVKFANHRWSASGDWSIRPQGLCPMRNPRNSWAVRIDESMQKVFTTKTFC